MAMLLTEDALRHADVDDLPAHAVAMASSS
jgi:hypothetical protein